MLLLLLSPALLFISDVKSSRLMRFCNLFRCRRRRFFVYRTRRNTRSRLAGFIFLLSGLWLFSGRNFLLGLPIRCLGPFAARVGGIVVATAAAAVVVLTTVANSHRSRPQRRLSVWGLKFLFRREYRLVRAVLLPHDALGDGVIGWLVFLVVKVVERRDEFFVLPVIARRFPLVLLLRGGRR